MSPVSRLNTLVCASVAAALIDLALALTRTVGAGSAVMRGDAGLAAIARPSALLAWAVLVMIVLAACRWLAETNIVGKDGNGRTRKQ